MTTPAKQQRRAGRTLRNAVPRSSHAGFAPAPDRADPVDTLRHARRGWIAALVPIRFERMRASPLAFFRGTASTMAADLVHTPSTGLRVQAVGDAHLLNFGGFGTPEGRLLFDVADFDETLQGPWEWDVKRLAASIELAARELDRDTAAAEAAVRGYRTAMSEFADMTSLEIYGHELDAGKAVRLAPGIAGDVERWSHHTSRWELPRLTTVKDGAPRIVGHEPITVRLRGSVAAALRELPLAYSRTLAEDRRALLARYEVIDVARHAVGVGSCGTHCYVVLLIGSDAGDPLFLQVKEARRSALEPFAGRSRVRHPGQRVVIGQRLAQAEADAFLGWGTLGRTGVYLRQLRDMRGAVDLRAFKSSQLTEYASLCGTALARAHARTGTPGAIAGYIGHGDRLDRAIAAFARDYADQTERDHAAFVKATRRKSSG